MLRLSSVEIGPGFRWLALLFPSSPLRAADPADWAAMNLETLVKSIATCIRPELSLKEKETPARIAQELRDVGADVTTNFGGYGVVGILANGPGPSVMIRTDLDALAGDRDDAMAYAFPSQSKERQRAGHWRNATPVATTCT